MARLSALVLLALPIVSSLASADESPETFFELKIRPVLTTDCLPCHGGKKTSRGVKVVEPPPDPTGWADRPIDRFVAANRRAAGLRPVRRADRRTLIRRVTFDLIGLPPTPEEIDDFLRDPTPGAFAEVVDRLLASPHYGERWGRHWMDVAHYADTAGDNADYPVPEVALYRDYIIDSFNKDKPYDHF